LREALWQICDPDDVDRRARADQQALIEQLGSGLTTRMLRWRQCGLRRGRLRRDGRIGLRCA
jgi:hypothetical protein